jgi:hypothetical protein
MGLIGGIVSAADPFEIGRSEILNPNVFFYNGYISRTQVSPVQIAEVCKGILCFGDSVIANSSPTAYTVTQAKNQNLNVLNGGLYVSADPLLGAGNGNGAPFIACSATRIGDNLITGAFCARSIMASHGAGGATVGDWAAGGALNKNIGAAIKRFQAVGLPLDAVIWHAGPNDNSQGTTQANYTTALASVISTIRAFTAATILIGVCSKNAGVAASNVTAAQIAAVNHGNAVWAGVNSDAYVAGNFQADGTHMSDTGNAALATDYVTQLHTAGVI